MDASTPAPDVGSPPQLSCRGTTSWMTAPSSVHAGIGSMAERAQVDAVDRMLELASDLWREEVLPDVVGVCDEPCLFARQCRVEVGVGAPTRWSWVHVRGGAEPLRHCGRGGDAVLEGISGFKQQVREFGGVVVVLEPAVEE